MNYLDCRFSKIIVLLIICLLLPLISGCKKTINDSESSNNKIQSSKQVYDSPTEIITFEDISKFKRGTKMKLRLNRDLLNVIEYDIFFEATSDNFGERLIYCKCPDTLLVGYGDSGSPILTEDGKIAGALCYGFYGNFTQFAARPIEELFSVESDTSNISKTQNIKSVLLDTDFRLIKPVSFIVGMDQSFIQRYKKYDRFGFLSRDNFVSPKKVSKNRLHKYGQQSSGNVIPGMSIAVMEAYGDLVAIGTSGTATYCDENKIFAFGHSIYFGSRYGTYLPPVQKAKLIIFVESSYESYKITLPTAGIVGALKEDKNKGILINTEVQPDTFSVITETTFNGGDTVTSKHYIATSSDVQSEYYLSNIAIVYSVYDIIKDEIFNPHVAEGLLQVSFESFSIAKSFNLYTDEYIDQDLYDFIRSVFKDKQEHITRVKLTIDVNRQSTITDIDGNIYKIVKIGDQYWMAENLKVTHYRNGEPIPKITDNTEWSNLSTGAQCAYKNDSSNSATYGMLYNWYAAFDSRNIAPAGWHVPTDEEYTALENYLIANGYNWDGTTTDDKTGKSLASKTGWNSSSEAGDIGNDMSTNNASGFSALPGGYRHHDDGSFYYIRYFGYWWSATECSSTSAWNRYLRNRISGFGRSNDNKRIGFSIRLIRD